MTTWWKQELVPDRQLALRRFGAAITTLTVVGVLVLGFEQSILQFAVAVAAAYATELLLETLRAKATRTPLRYRGNWRQVVDFLLPAHISALPATFLLYANDRLAPVAFAAVVAVASKYIVKIQTESGERHVLNPSNTAILLTLLLLPDVSVSPVWMFLSRTHGVYDLLLPCVIFCTGSFLNYRFVRRWPLIVGWLGAFVAQGLCRWLFLDAALGGVLAAASGPVALLFTFYMVTDPGTTPNRVDRQLAFGASVGLLYGVFMATHVVYALFWALFVICSVRGVIIYVISRTTKSDGASRVDAVPPHVSQAAGA